eukprot:UN00558
MALILTSLSVFAISSVYAGEPSRDLFDVDVATTVAFFDFDRTLLIESLGGKVRDLCLNLSINTSQGCSGEGDMVAALDAYADTVGRVEQAFGGEERIERLKAFFDRLLESGSSIPDETHLFVLSTSWEPIPSVQWEDMIFVVLETVGLDVYFSRARVLGLDDPGPGIQADKGSRAEAELVDLGITVMAECIFADDKLGNLNWANCDGFDADGDSCDDYGGTRRICDGLLIQERAGLDGTDMNYFEARSRLPFTRVVT